MNRYDATALYFRVADPADDGPDGLDCGSGPAGQEEQRYFRDRAWTGAVDGRECRCIELLLEDGTVVGYAAFQIVPKPHPALDSKTKADYLFLYHLCIAKAFQGKMDEQSEGRPKFSVLAMRLVDTIAATEGCVGVYLNVRADNEPAKALYGSLGYVSDGDYSQKGTGLPMLRRRKLVSA